MKKTLKNSRILKAETISTPTTRENVPQETAIGKHKKSFYATFGLAGCLLLSGCTGSTYSSHFDCPMGEGAGCASLSRVNKMIDRGAIDLGSDDVPFAKGDVAHTASNNQVYVYYGPEHLGRLISPHEFKTPSTDQQVGSS